MCNNEKLNVTLEWAGDIPYQLVVGVEIIWRNENVKKIEALPKTTETIVTLPRIQAVKFSRIVLAGLQADKFIVIGERLKEQTEKLLTQQAAFREEVIKFGADRMIKDAKNQAHRRDCPRCDACERETCDGCDIAELCADSTCTDCPEKEGCWALASEDDFCVDDEDCDEDEFLFRDEDGDEDYEDDYDDDDDEDDDDDGFWCEADDNYDCV